MSFAGLLNKSATITRKSYTNNGPSPGTSTATVASAVPCRLHYLSAKELGESYDPSVAQYTIYMPHGTDINSSDTVTVDSNTYEVHGVNEDAGGMSHHIEVTAQRVK